MAAGRIIKGKSIGASGTISGHQILTGDARAFNKLIQKKITKNGTYKAEEDGAAGYSSLIIDVDPEIEGHIDIENTEEYNVAKYATARISEAEREKLIPDNIPEGMNILGIQGTRMNGDKAEAELIESDEYLVSFTPANPSSIATAQVVSDNEYQINYS